MSVCTEIPLKVETRFSAKLDYDDFKLLEEIGGGSYGTVYHGEWRNQEVAIKVLKKERNPVNFQKECAMLQELRCPYIVNFIGYCAFPTRLSLVTEFMPLGSLSKYIFGDKIDNHYRLLVATDCAKAMAFLHRCGLIHRDLKPDNILIVSLEASYGIHCKLADFGTSKHFNEVSVNKYGKKAKRLSACVGSKPKTNKQTKEYACVSAFSL